MSPAGGKKTPVRRTKTGTIRRYSFTTTLESGHEDALRLLEEACRQHWWFREPVVRESVPLSFTFMVTGRDQWWVHKRAVDLAVNAVYAAGGRETDIAPPTWEKLPPHDERGYGLLI